MAPFYPATDFRVENALRPQTRIIVFNHMTWEMGHLLPAKEICARARRHGILPRIDGAHGIGHIPRDLHDLGCDFYATNGQVDEMPAKRSGLLHPGKTAGMALGQYRKRGMAQLRTQSLSFLNLGTSDLSIIVGIKAALDFVNVIGPERIYARAPWVRPAPGCPRALLITKGACRGNAEVPRAAKVNLTPR